MESVSDEMVLLDLLRDWKDGDDHGWMTEFAWLLDHHTLQLDSLLTSIRQTGMRTPVTLGDDGRVWDGHHRLCVAWLLDLVSVPVRIVGSPSISSVPSSDFGASLDTSIG